MKRFSRCLVVVILSVCMATIGLSATGCGPIDDEVPAEYGHLFERNEGDLYVRYFKGGNGDEWLWKIADDFVKETGIGVYLKSDDDATQEMRAILQTAHPTSGTPSASILSRLPDVVMTQTERWQDFVNRDYIRELDEVYNYVYEDEEGKPTLKDKLLDSVANFGYKGQTPDDAAAGDKHYWVVPWTLPMTGIIYNVNMLKSLGGKWANGYTPATATELLELVDDLAAAGKTAFSWGGSGTNMGYWNFLFMSLWTSYQGYKTGYEGGRGKYGPIQDFYDFANDAGVPDTSYGVFEQAGRKIALKLIQDLLAVTDSDGKPTRGGNNGGWKNSIKGPVEKTAYEAQDAFAFEQAAMIPSGGWIKNEIKESVEEGFEYALMPTPAVDLAYVQKVAEQLNLTEREIHGGLLENGSFETESTQNPEYAQINNTEVGDLIYIPRNAVRQEEAVKFLQFLNRKENVEHATRVMGIARPFKYKPSETGEASYFTKSVFSVYETPNAIQFVRVSEHNMFTYASLKEWGVTNDSDIYLNLINKTALELINDNAQNARDNWNTWIATYL